VRILGNTTQDPAAVVDYYLRIPGTNDVVPELAEDNISAPKFRSWIGSNVSLMLFILPETSFSRVSAGSYVTASLAQAFTEIEDLITLVHFCRAPPATPDPTTNPARECMANLVCQLLQAHHVDQSIWTAWTLPLSRHDHKQWLRGKRLIYLCDLFKHLVSSIPYGRAVFVLLDDFFYLEQTASRESTAAIIGCLSELATNGTVATFKLLVMTPDLRGNVVPYLDRWDFLRMSGASSRRPRDRWSERQIMLGIEQAMQIGARY